MQALAAAATVLTIAFSPDGGQPFDTWTIRCPATGGSPICRRLNQLDNPFAPVPKDAACTQVYGGPQVARVTGRFRGRKVWAVFQRRDGCEIARWNKHAFLFRRP